MGIDGEIGPRLRSERESRGLSQRELARRLGLSPSLISQIEKGQSRPSVSTLYAMVNELGLSLDELLLRAPDARPDTGAPARPPVPGPVRRPDDRAVIVLESGVRWERIADGSGAHVDFLYVIYEVGGASSEDGAMMRHAGREYGYVISGRLAVQIAFDTHELGPGDGISFDSTMPHRLSNIGDEPVHAIWFVLGRAG
ncbi:MAG: helix-turn-helix domain-containing protein [Nitriliruptorales bacterium]|nr:helix-turn-helix domain-containing protein [Nitriliruptorales bacterium]